MAHNRSFKEYIANRFYNELYAAIEEYARIQNEEAGLQDAPAQEITQEKDGRTMIQDKIAELMGEKPEITTKEIAHRLGLTSDNVKYRIRILRETGRVEHQGSTKAEKWVILKREEDDT